MQVMNNLSSVYLLTLKNKPYFKIGKADSIFSENTTSIEFRDRDRDDLYLDEMKLALSDIYKYFHKLEQQPHINSDIKYGKNWKEESSRSLQEWFKSPTVKFEIK